MKRYLIRWENFAVYAITAYSDSGITYINDDFLITASLESAKIGLEAIGISCDMIDNEINNPMVSF